MRRGFWLVAGAALGVTGYRRASRLARRISPAALAQGGSQLRSAASFVRDVRDGMADYRVQRRGTGDVRQGENYRDLHGRQIGHRLGSRSLGNAGDRSQSAARQRGRLEP
jgi:hypothetical protein